MKNNNWGRTAMVGGVLCAIGAASLFLACSDDPETVNTAPTADAGTVETSTTDSGEQVNCPAEAPRTCTASGCTSQLGEPAVCVENQCVKLKTPNCPRAGGAVDNDDAIVIGVVHSNRGTNKTAGDICNNAIELAVNEINKAGGVPQADKCKKSRPLAYIACDDTKLNADGTPVSADAGAYGAETLRNQSLDHLAGELKVPAIVGGVSSGDVTDMAKYVIPKFKTMFFTTRGSSNYLKEPEKAPVAALQFQATQDGTRLFWRATQNVEIQAKGLQLAYYQLETKLTADRGRPVKTALVMKNDAYGQGLGGLFYQGLKVNGAVADQANANFRSYSYRFTNGTDGTCVTIAQGGACIQQLDQPAVVADLEGFKPDIVIHVGTDENIIAPAPQYGLLDPYEKWIQDNNIAENERPYYLGAHGLRNAKLTTLVDGITTQAFKDDFRKRTRGFFPGRSTPASQDFFNFRFKPAYNDGAALIPGVLEGYDAMYVLAYTMAAASGKGPITSKSVVEAMPTILSGTERVNVGPQPFAATAKRLAAGEKINLDGVFSALDFDPQFGEAPSDATIWCIGIDPNSSKAFFNDATGQYYDSAGNKLTGTYACQ